MNSSASLQSTLSVGPLEDGFVTRSKTKICKHAMAQKTRFSVSDSVEHSTPQSKFCPDKTVSKMIERAPLPQIAHERWAIRFGLQKTCIYLAMRRCGALLLIDQGYGICQVCTASARQRDLLQFPNLFSGMSACSGSVCPDRSKVIL